MCHRSLSPRRKRFRLCPRLLRRSLLQHPRGISTAQSTQYQGLLNLFLAADFEKLGINLPGRFIILGQNSHGRGLTTDIVGDAQVLSNIDSFENIAQIGEYWWEIPLIEDKLTVRIGKQDVNTEFLVIDRAVDYIQSGFSLTPSLAVPTYPDNSAAIMLMANLSEAIDFKIGIWDGVPNGGNWGFSGTGINLTITELQYKFALQDDRLPGVIAMGAEYGSPGIINGTSVSKFTGYYVEWEQTIYREAESKAQGLDIFFHFSASNDEVGGEFPKHFLSGFTYRGLLPSREKDLFGIGISYVELLFGGTNRESVVELFYKAEICPNLYLQPDMQYIASPSGIYPDSLVVGTRFELAY